MEGFRHETTNKGILVKMLVSVLKTNQLVSKNYMVDDVSEQTYYNETLGFNCPEWRKWCREKEMSENEIREVVLLGIKTIKDF